MNVVNLNKARKVRAKGDAKRQADENAVRFGRTKVEKNQTAAQQDKASAHLDGHKTDKT